MYFRCTSGNSCFYHLQRAIMKRIFIIVFGIIFVSVTSRAQHTLQLDSGPGGQYGVISANPLWPPGVTNFMMPPTGGTLIVVPPPGFPSAAWLTGSGGGPTGNVLTDNGGG